MPEGAAVLSYRAKPLLACLAFPFLSLCKIPISSVFGGKSPNCCCLNKCYRFAAAFLCALKFPKFIFCPHEELKHLLCLFFSLPPQQITVVIFKCRKYFVNYSWVNTPHNYFKALQFFHAHCVPTESSHLGNQIILKYLMGKVILNKLLFPTSCSNDLYLFLCTKNSFIKHLYQHPSPPKPNLAVA